MLNHNEKSCKDKHWDFLLIGLIVLIVAVRWETPIEEQDQKQQASMPVDIMEVRTTIENKTLRYIGVVFTKANSILKL